MASESTSKGYRRVRVQKGLRPYTYLGCPLTKNRSPWCFRLCNPDLEGAGLCGRVAPHGFKSHIQQGIEDFKKRRAASATLPLTQVPPDNQDA